MRRARHSGMIITALPLMLAVLLGSVGHAGVLWACRMNGTVRASRCCPEKPDAKVVAATMVVGEATLRRAPCCQVQAPPARVLLPAEAAPELRDPQSTEPTHVVGAPVLIAAIDTRVHVVAPQSPRPPPRRVPLRLLKSSLLV